MDNKVQSYKDLNWPSAGSRWLEKLQVQLGKTTERLVHRFSFSLMTVHVKTGFSDPFTLRWRFRVSWKREHSSGYIYMSTIRVDVWDFMEPETNLYLSGDFKHVKRNQFFLKRIFRNGDPVRVWTLIPDRASRETKEKWETKSHMDVYSLQEWFQNTL